MYLVKYNYFNEGELDAKLQTVHSLQINTVVTYQKQLYLNHCLFRSHIQIT